MKTRLPALLLLCLPLTSLALEPLEEASLREVDGGALGLALSNFGLQGQAQGSTPDMIILTASGAQLGFNSFRLWGQNGSGYADIGSAADPIWLDVATLSRLGISGGSVSRDLVVFGTPSNAGKLNLSATMGFVMEPGHPGLINGITNVCCGLPTAVNIGTFGGWNMSRMQLTGVNLSNTNIELWEEPGKGVAYAGRINLGIDRLETQTQLSNNGGGNGVPVFQGDATVANSGALRMDNLSVSLALGHLFYQPLYFDSPDGRNFKLALEPINTNTYSKLYDYNNGPYSGGAYTNPAAGHPSTISWSGSYLNGQSFGGGSIKNVTIHQLELVTTGL